MAFEQSHFVSHAKDGDEQSKNFLRQIKEANAKIEDPEERAKTTECSLYIHMAACLSSLQSCCRIMAKSEQELSDLYNFLMTGLGAGLGFGVLSKEISKEQFDAMNEKKQGPVC